MSNDTQTTIGIAERAEYEATWFAMAFLMPEGWFRARWSETSGDWPKIAQEARVPAAFARARAQGLGLQ